MLRCCCAVGVTAKQSDLARGANRKPDLTTSERIGFAMASGNSTVAADQPQVRRSWPDYIRNVRVVQRYVTISDLMRGIQGCMCDSHMGGVYPLTLCHQEQIDGRRHWVFRIDNRQSDSHGRRLWWDDAELGRNVFVEELHPLKGGAA